MEEEEEEEVEEEEEAIATGPGLFDSQSVPKDTSLVKKKLPEMEQKKNCFKARQVANFCHNC